MATKHDVGDRADMKEKIAELQKAVSDRIHSGIPETNTPILERRVAALEREYMENLGHQFRLVSFIESKLGPIPGPEEEKS